MLSAIDRNHCPQSIGTPVRNRRNPHLNKAITLARLGRSDEADKVYDDLIGRYGTADDPGLRKVVTAARSNKGVGA
jgi:hypothetical protein